MRFLLYVLIGYLVYLYFIKPLMNGYKEKPASGQKKKPTVQPQDERSNQDDQYIDYEEIK